jgi:hypothetical protein
MLQEFNKELVNEARIKELLELCKKEQPQMDSYWLWLCCVDFHIREELKMDPPARSDLITIFEKERETLLYENIKIET